MLLAIDAHKLDTIKPTGTDRVTNYFLRHLPSDLSSHFDHIVLYTKKPIDSNLKMPFPENVINYPINLPFFWSSLGLSWQCFWKKPDVLFVPSHSLPFISGKKNAVIIHDIGFLSYPQNYSTKQYLHLVNTTKYNLKKADIIITPSQFVKKTLIDTYYADPNKIRVVNLGVDLEKFHPNFSKQEIEAVFSKYDPIISKKPYFLFVGRLDQRKNISNIIIAFNQFKKINKTDHILVLAGQPGQGFAEIEKTILASPFSQDIIQLNYIDDQHLPVILSEAELFIFPTLYEGFGLPILEAQACGTPVITSNLTAMPEIAGEGAVLVDPAKPDEICSAIGKICVNTSLKSFLKDKGLINAKKYNWSKFSMEVFQILIELSQKI